MDLSDAGATDADDVVIDLIRDWHEVGIGHVDCVFTYDVVDGKCLAVKVVFDGSCAKYQKDCAS